MGLFDFFTRKSSVNVTPPLPTKQDRVDLSKLEYPIADFQWEFVKSEIEKLNELFKTLKYTKKLHMDSNALTDNCYFRFTPFTPKTGKISKYPCMLYACSSVYMGYTVSLHYDINDKIGKGTVNIATSKYNYSVDLRTVNNELKIMKVIATDDNLNNEKLYHVMKNGKIYHK